MCCDSEIKSCKELIHGNENYIIINFSGTLSSLGSRFDCKEQLKVAKSLWKAKPCNYFQLFMNMRFPGVVLWVAISYLKVAKNSLNQILCILFLNQFLGPSGNLGSCGMGCLLQLKVANSSWKAKPCNTHFAKILCPLKVANNYEYFLHYFYLVKPDHLLKMNPFCIIQLFRPMR